METNSTTQLGERVRRAWKDYDVCPDFEEQMDALIGCVTALERIRIADQAKFGAGGDLGNGAPTRTDVVSTALERLEKVLP